MNPNKKIKGIKENNAEPQKEERVKLSKIWEECWTFSSKNIVDSEQAQAAYIRR